MLKNWLGLFIYFLECQFMSICILFSLGVYMWLGIAQHTLCDFQELTFRQLSQLYILLQLNIFLSYSVTRKKKHLSIAIYKYWSKDWCHILPVIPESIVGKNSRGRAPAAPRPVYSPGPWCCVECAEVCICLCVWRRVSVGCHLVPDSAVDS